jgi:hypothetical protein
MMKPKHGYRGVAFAVTKLRDGRWSWVFYPKKDDGLTEQGIAEGSCKEAEIACKNAIDLWLGGGPPGTALRNRE